MRVGSFAVAATLLLAQLALCGGAMATDSRAKVEAAISKPAVRGAIVFKHYCTLCHGELADGAARAAKLYGDLDLTISPRSVIDYEKIIRTGGAGVGRSPFMPPWEGELSEEQIGDVIAYLAMVGDPVRRGEVVFKANCVLCHGVKGDGKGRASVLYDPPPANLTISDKNDMYKEMIITNGGAAMGRSSVMPVWGEQLSPREIKDVVAYLRSILVVPPPE